MTEKILPESVRGDRKALLPDVIKALPATRRGVSDALSGRASHSAVKVWLADLHACGSIHISAWEITSNGRETPVFSEGLGADVPKPTRSYTQAVQLPEQADDYSDEETPNERAEREENRRRARRYADRAAKHGCPLVNFLFGRATGYDYVALGL